MATSSISARIRSFIDHIGLTDNAFAKKIGITQSVIASMFKRQTEPSSKLISAILQTYTDLSAEWLMRGNGLMNLSEAKNDDDKKKLNLMLDTMSNMQENINEKNRIIFELESKLRKLEGELAMMKNELCIKKA